MLMRLKGIALNTGLGAMGLDIKLANKLSTQRLEDFFYKLVQAYTEHP